MANLPLHEVVRRRLRAKRLERGLTQEALCERAGLSLDAVTRIERGSRVPKLDTLERLADALDVSLVDLVRSDVPARAPAVAKPVRRVLALIERQPAHVVEAVEAIARVLIRALDRGSQRSR
jgi:transcriptional regulator with XRE-family HTH domain